MTTALLQPEDWNRIENFIGFGNPSAPYVFLGMEEGLLSEATLDEDLVARSAYDQYMDLHDAQSKLAGTEKYFGEHPVNQPSWRPICDLMLRLTESFAHPTLPQRLRYQADRLGRRDGDTLLAELMPYPRERADKNLWPYKKFGRFADYDAYRTALLDKRLGLLHELFGMPCRRQLVVAYGKSDWSDFRKLFDTNWTSVPPFDTGRVGETAVVLAPHLSTRAFNGEEDLDRFADTVRTALRS